MRRRMSHVACAAVAAACVACATTAPPPEWEVANPLQPLPESPLGIDGRLAELPDPPTPERVRLGRWLFYDARISANGSVSCASCHRPEQAFSEPTPVSTGIGGQQGSRKSPSFVNAAFAFYPNFFWDGRASSLEEQALGPIANPIEMGNTHDRMIQTLTEIDAYKPYFVEAFGSEDINTERVAKAIADYERTCLSGNSPWDRWRRHQDEAAVSDEVKQGHELFFGKAGCSTCHVGQTFSDSLFHNLGVGWNEETKTFADEGRFTVTGEEVHKGAFKTPTLRDVALHPPYLHDGSAKSLEDVVELYDDGGMANPYLDPKMKKLGLTAEEVHALVSFMNALTGEFEREKPLTSFPR
jgi:cytochrome c peroxidase